MNLLPGEFDAVATGIYISCSMLYVVCIRSFFDRHVSEVVME